VVPLSSDAVVTAADEDLPLTSEIARIEAALLETQKDIARLRAELADAEDAAGGVRTLPTVALSLMAGRLGLAVGFLWTFLGTLFGHR
jgi:hypothetical protein